MKKLSDQIAIVQNKYSVGEIRILGTTSLNDNEMMCFGQEVCIRDYPELFAEIGTTFGTGNGPNTFRLPDFRGIALSGLDSMGGVAAKRIWQLNPQLSSLGGTDRTWVDSIHPDKPLWWSNYALSGYGHTQIPSGMSINTDFSPRTNTGLTTGTGGNTLYSTHEYSSAMTNTQPTISLIYAINLGRNRIDYNPVPQPADGPTDLEWAGPFIDQINVVTEFGADPTGTTDSTAAIQAAINAACNGYQIGNISDPYTFFGTLFVYIPPGTYLISDSLRLGDSRENPATRANGVTIFGHSPDTTILKWIGPNDYRTGIMWSAGAHDSIVARLQFDGQGSNVIGFRLERDFSVPLNQSYNRIQDCTFKDLGCGFANTDYISGASTDSEQSILRCRFYRCSNYGVTTIAAEAYDYWVRECYFEECGKGVGVQMEDGYSNFYPHYSYWNNGSGQFCVYDSVFNASKECDIFGVHGSTIGIRRNVSINSFRFYIGYSGLVSITDNRVIYPVTTDCMNQISQWGGNGSQRGSLWFANNEFCMRSDAEGAIYRELYNIPQDSSYGFRLNEINNDQRYTDAAFMAYNNKFNVAYEDVFHLDPRLSNVVIGTQINQTIDDSLPLLPAQTPNVSRQIFYLKAISWITPDELPIQQQVDEVITYAQENPGSWPVIYAPKYAIGTIDVGGINPPVVIPANTQLAIQGQGYLSTWNKVANNLADRFYGIDQPMFILKGPTQVKFYHMGTVQGKDNTWGRMIVIDNTDHPSARLISDNCSGTLRMFTSNVQCFYTDHAPYFNNFDDWCNSSNWSSSGDGFFMFEGAATSHGLPSPGLDPQRFPIMTMQSGSKCFLRDIWNEGDTAGLAEYIIKGNNAVQDTLFNYQSSREGFASAITSGYAYSNLKFIDVKGQAVVSAGGGVANIIGDSSQFTYQCWNGSPAVDHGYYLTKYNGQDIVLLGMVYTDQTNLPGWPTSYTGNINDCYITSYTGHMWVWDGAQWVDIGGPIGTIGSKELLPGWPDRYVSDLPVGHGWHWTGTEWITRAVDNSTPAPYTLDGYFVLDTMTYWQWNGSIWIEISGMPMPSTYWHYLATTGGYSQMPRWFAKYPNGIGGSLPNDYQDALDLMSSVRPVVYPQPLGPSITDARFERSYYNIELWSDEYKTFDNSNLVVSYDTADVQSYPRIGYALYNLSATPNTALLDGYINFLTDGGGALEFNGESTYCTLTNSQLPSGNNPCTMICWAKTYSTSSGYQWIFSYGTSTDHQTRALGINGSTAYFAGYGDDISGGTIVENQWFQIAGVFDGSIATLYINGTEIASNTVSWDTVTPPVTLSYDWRSIVSSAQIGRQTNNNEYWNGTISIVQVWNRALNDTEIAEEFYKYNTRYGL